MAQLLCEDGSAGPGCCEVSSLHCDNQQALSSCLPAVLSFYNGVAQRSRRDLTQYLERTQQKLLEVRVLELRFSKFLNQLAFVRGMLSHGTELKKYEIAYREK